MKYDHNKVHSTGTDPKLNDFIKLAGKTLIYGTIAGLTLSGSIIAGENILDQYLIKPIHSYAHKK